MFSIQMPMYYRNTTAAIIAFDVSQIDTFWAAKRWANGKYAFFSHTLFSPLAFPSDSNS
jgi:GTPase SAR1 family protein